MVVCVSDQAADVESGLLPFVTVHRAIARLDPPVHAAFTIVIGSIQSQISMIVFPRTMKSQTRPERPAIQEQASHAIGNMEASAFAWRGGRGLAQIQLFQDGLFLGWARMKELFRQGQVRPGLHSRDLDGIERAVVSRVDQGGQFFHQGVGVASHMALADVMSASGFITDFLERIDVIAHQHIGIHSLQDGFEPGFQLFGFFARQAIHAQGETLDGVQTDPQRQSLPATPWTGHIHSHRSRSVAIQQMGLLHSRHFFSHRLHCSIDACFSHPNPQRLQHQGNRCVTQPQQVQHDAQPTHALGDVLFSHPPRIYSKRMSAFPTLVAPNLHRLVLGIPDVFFTFWRG